MQTLQTIVLFLSGMACAALTWLAVWTWLRARRQERLLTDMAQAVAKTYALTTAMSIDREVERLNEMNRMKRECVEREEFEQAAKLQKLIKAQEQKVQRAVEEMQQTFGGKVEVKVENI